MQRRRGRLHTRGVTASARSSLRGAPWITAFAVSSSLGCASVLGLDDFTDAGGGGATSGAAGSTGDTTATGTTATGAVTSTVDAASTGTSGDGGGPDQTASSAGGGGNGSGGDTGSGGTGGDGEGGAGGAGGGGVTCLTDDEFVVFTSLELGQQAVDDERIVVLSRPSSNRVHVGVNAGISQIVARTVRVAAVPDLRSVVTYPQVADGIRRRIIGGYTTAQSVVFWGEENGRFGEFEFPGNDDIGNTNVVFTPYPMPSGCTRGRAIDVRQGEDGVVRFAATCSHEPVANFATLYVGKREAVEFVLTNDDVINDEPVPHLNVRGYGYVAGEHVLFTGPDDFSPNDGGFVRFGATANEMLSSIKDVQPPPNHGVAFVVGPEIDARMFLAALHADPVALGNGQLDGAYRTGSVVADDLPGVAADLVSALPDAIPFTDFAEVAPPFQVQRAGAFVVGAAVSNFSLAEPNRVRINLWEADGTILIANFAAAQAPDNFTFLAAGAASSGFGNLTTVWSEVVGGDYRVRATNVQCVLP